MKGIILAGGSGSRLHPLTRVISKQLLPVYDKPMIYYPLSTLMLAGVREVLLISTPHDLPLFEALLGDGKRLGMELRYAVQPKPDGLAQAFHIGADFVGEDPCCLVLGDNVFFGNSMTGILASAAGVQDGAVVFGYHVRDPERYGVVEFDRNDNVLSLEEKPSKPKSNYAVPGLYFYGRDVVAMARDLPRGSRGEYEITDLNRKYLEQGRLKVARLGRGIAWFDTGTHKSLLDAANFIMAVDERQGLKIACLEEIALGNGWIDRAAVEREAQSMGKSEYARYLWDTVLADPR